MSKRLPEFTDVQGMERFTGGDYLEAKQLLAYASGQTQGIILKDLQTGEEKKVTSGGPGEGNPAFSPQGDRMLFLAVVPGEGRQIFTYHLETEEIFQVTHIRGAAMEPVWSPDGSKILFGAPISGGGGTAKIREDDPIVIEDFGYKFDGLGFIRPDQHVHLYVVPSTGGEAVQLTSGNCDFIHHNWTVDSKAVVAASDMMRSKEEGLGYDLLHIDVDTKAVRRLTQGLWLVSYPNPMRPVCTPDGKSVIVGVLDPSNDLSNNDGGYPEVYLFRVPLDGGEVECIFMPDEQCYQCVQFPYNAFSGWGMEKLQLSDDGRYAYFVAGWQGQCNIYKLDLEGNKHAQLLAGGKQVYHGLSKVQNGKMLVTRCTVDMPESYYLMDAETGELLEKVAQSAQDIIDHVQISKAEDFCFETLDGESSVHGWVLPPHNAKPGEKYPTILYVHGGPHPFYTYGFTMEHQCFAAAGFGVIWCNPRGSSGYGWKHQTFAASQDGRAYNDCLQFAAEAAKRYDWIDSERMGITGGSYGGWMTNYMATHAKQFKAYITQRSIANEMISYASSDMQGVSKKFKHYEDFMMAKIKESHVAYAENVDKPMLILHGLDDYRCPVEHVHQFYTAIKDIHPELPVKMMIFPHTAHHQPEDPRQAKVYYQAMVDWFTEYL